MHFGLYIHTTYMIWSAEKNFHRKTETVSVVVLYNYTNIYLYSWGTIPVFFYVLTGYINGHRFLCTWSVYGHGRRIFINECVEGCAGCLVYCVTLYWWDAKKLKHFTIYTYTVANNNNAELLALGIEQAPYDSASAKSFGIMDIAKMVW